MKIFGVIAVMASIAITTAVFVPPRPGHKKLNVGPKECAKGQFYWCQNLTIAAGCHAVPHCIQNVWIHKKLPPDTSSVCQICLDMVKQARDQLRSNETQELLKQVFEGSCALMRLKPIVKECDKIVDEFIPELIETLSSEMNPQMVCATAGLCNSDRIHKMLEASGEELNKDIVQKDSEKPINCQGCHTVVGLIEEKFDKMSRDEVLQGFLQVCRKMSSFSDGCSNIIITYFSEIYTHLQDNLNPNEVCLLSGTCSAQFHKHAKVEITPISHIGYVPVGDPKDDLPCDLCKQLVSHLRDVLIANTTVTEFKKVLEGLCRQSGKFADECLALVDQYYDIIYNFLLTELDSGKVCDAIGICKLTEKKDVFMAPLLPPNTAKLALSLMSPENKPLVHIKLHKEPSSVRILPPTQPQQLPLDLIMPPHTQILYNKETCEFCEYLLHYVQEAITDPKTEEKIKEIIDSACSKLPSSVNATCINFINNYEPAFVAILAQEIDPSQICPLIKACPASNNTEVEIFMQAKGDSKCPLCLFAVTKLENMVKSKNTEENIKHSLSKLCAELPSNLKDECQDFVQTYTDELVEMLVADLKPDEVCVYLKLCSDNKPASSLPDYVLKIYSGNIETNVIPDNTINGKVINTDDVVEDGPQCVLCEFVMKEIENQLKNQKTDEHIKEVVRDICNVLPKTIKTQCNDFVDQYGDTVIQLLIQALEPSEICRMMKLCQSQKYVEISVAPGKTLDDKLINSGHSAVEGSQCTICEFVMTEIKQQLSDEATDEQIKSLVKNICKIVPGSIRTQCDHFIDQNGDTIIKLLSSAIDPATACSVMRLCKSQMEVIRTEILECPICEMAVEIMERILSNPKVDHDIEHVFEKTCRGLPKQYRNKCTDVIAESGNIIMDLLLHHTDKYFVCKKIGYCKASLHEIVID